MISSSLSLSTSLPLALLAEAAAGRRTGGLGLARPHELHSSRCGRLMHLWRGHSGDGGGLCGEGLAGGGWSAGKRARFGEPRASQTG
jgi:hypothetical protein